jgi:hypothetical protein
MSRLFERISTAVLEGDPEKAGKLTQRALEQGEAA